MAKAITRTRAEVAGIKPSGAPSVETDSAPADSVTAPPAPNNVLAAALRIRDVAWAMRGHGFDPAVCQQLEELAATILSASSLGDPADRRTSKLTEVLTYLERRINSLLDESAQAMAGDTKPTALAHANGHDATDYKQFIERMNGNEATATVPEPEPAVAADAKTPPAPAPDVTATRAPVPVSGSSARPNELARATLPDLDLPPSRIVLRPGSTRAVTRETTDSALLHGIDTMTTLRTFDMPAQVPAEPAQTVPVEKEIVEEPEPSADAREPVESALAPAPGETAGATAAAADDLASETTAGAKTDAVESTSIDALSEAAAASPIETAIEPLVEAATVTPVAPHAVQASAAPLDPDDPLALLMAMSEAERIALFS
jgi:hypothetical protein